MKKINMMMGIAVALMITQFQISAQKEVSKSFAAKEKLKISTASGNCKIQRSSDNKINVRLIYTYPDDCFKYKFDESTEYLKITEDFDGNCSGKSDWTISVPENTEIDYNTASGDFEINGTSKGVSGNSASGNVSMEDVSGEISLNTASGDVIMVNIKGTIELNTASGNVKLESISAKSKITTASGDVMIKNSTDEVSINVASGNVNIQSSKSRLDVNSASGDVISSGFVGSLNLNTASGNIEAGNIEITGQSSLNAASGDIIVDLAKSTESDLNLSTASGNVNLDYNGNEIKGFFEFTARVDKGDIVSPVKFDKEEVVVIDGKKYDKKSFTKGSSNPRIILKTSSGTVQLKK